MQALIRDPRRDPGALAEAVRLLRAGQPVAFPTETVYGLGAPAFDPAAVARVFALKGRPADNPLIVHVDTPMMLDRLVRALPPAAEALIQAFWPGPLALVLPKAAAVPDCVTAGLDTVAVRMPQHAVALSLIGALGEPLAAPSANRSGRPSPTCAAHVAADFGQALPLILDGGPALHGLESTVLDLAAAVPTILRPGSISSGELCAVIGEVREMPEAPDCARSPGLRHLHYAPDCRILLGDAANLATLCADRLRAGLRVGLLCRSPVMAPAGLSLARQVSGDVAAYGREIFSVFRAAEQQQLDVLVVETVPAQGLGVAIMDRLRRAAAGPVPVS